MASVLRMSPQDVGQMERAELELYTELLNEIAREREAAIKARTGG